MILATHGIVGSSIGQFDVSYQTILNYATTQGYTKPSAAQQIKQNKLVVDLKTAGIWSKLDTFAVFATDGNSNFALIDWIRLSQYTAVNSPTFTTNQGFQANIVSAYVDANFIIGTHTVNATQNDMAFGGYNFSGSSGFGIIIGAQVRMRFTDGQSRINSSTSNNFAGLVTTGFASLNRPNSSTKIAYMNGNQVGINTADNSNIFSGSYTYGWSNGGGIGIGYASCIFLGASFDATENLDFSNAFNTYITSI